MAVPDISSESQAPCVDVLVLGAGLAGLRAGIAALESRPASSVLCCTQAKGPAGSSFANVNNALGMQVLAGDKEQEAFFQRVLEIGSPGDVAPELVRLLAQEAVPRLEDLLRWGVPFRQAGQGLQAVLQARVTGCFFQQQQSAAIFHDLGRAYTALASRFRELGGRLEAGVSVEDLLLDDADAVRGALLRRAKTVGPTRQPARSVVLALGGPASLFGRNVCGSAVSGWSWALLRRAGATLRNVGFLQFMWHSIAPRRFLDLGSLARQGWQIQERGGELSIPGHLHEHAQSRSSHCPFGYGLPDAALDRFLLRQRDPAGVVRLRPSNAAQWQEAAVFAHAGNGGAVINVWGQTGIPGLHACGECATTMHGANRIGGGMVLATQVFGARAGASAALEASELNEPLDLLPAGWQQADETPLCNPRIMDWLGRMLSDHAVCDAGAEALPGLAQEVIELQQNPLHPEDRLRLETVSIILEHQLLLQAQGESGA